MKVANMNGTVTNYAPEYEDCRRIASKHQVPLKCGVCRRRYRSI